MLQFGGTFGITTTRHVARSWHLTAALFTSPIVNTNAVQNVKINNMSTMLNKKMHTRKLDVEQEKRDILNVKTNQLSIQYFNKIKASLIKNFPAQDTTIVNEIKLAESVNDLLKITSMPGISNDYVIKIISAVTTFTQNKDKQSDKVIDGITKKLYEDLPQVTNHKTFTSEVLQFIKSPEDMIILLKLSTDQLVQVLSYLRLKKNRDPRVLREISNKISKSSNKLDIKQSTDVLHSLSVLNFPHEELLQKITKDLVETMPINYKPFIINSILTSIGKLRFKDENFLNVICKWILKNHHKLRTESFLIFLQTLAVIGYKDNDTINFIQNHIHPLKSLDMNGMGEWIDLVWSLSVLDQVKPDHLSSVLNETFLQKIKDVHTGVPKFLKLLNINGVAQLFFKQYKGPFISKEYLTDFGLYVKKSKEEEMGLLVMAETLRNVFPSATHFKININLQMGFFIDAECAFDRNSNPLNVNNKNVDCVRIAIIKYGYNHYCKGEKQLIGLVQLQERLLNAAGYKVLAIPMDSFSKKDKLVDRVKYINDNLRSIVKQSFA